MGIHLQEYREFDNSVAIWRSSAFWMLAIQVALLALVLLPAGSGQNGLFLFLSIVSALIGSFASLLALTLRVLYVRWAILLSPLYLISALGCLGAFLFAVFFIAPVLLEEVIRVGQIVVEEVIRIGRAVVEFVVQLVIVVVTILVASVALWDKLSNGQ